MLNKLKTKTRNALTAVEAGIIMGMMNVSTYATGLFDDTIEIKEGMNAEKIFGMIIGLVLGVFQMVGAVMLIYGIVQVVQTIQDNNADQRQKGLIAAFVGAIMFSLKWLLQGFGIIA